MCKVSGCENEVVAFGLCWEHACRAADVLGQTAPAVQMRASGVLPVNDEQELADVIAFDRAMTDAVGVVMRTKLGVS